MGFGMYETRSGTKLAIPNGVFGALLGGAFAGAVMVVAALVSIASMWGLVAGYDAGWINVVRDSTWLVATMSYTTAFLVYIAVYFASIPVVSNSDISVPTWLGMLVRSVWGSATVVWFLASLALFTAAKFVDSTVWGGGLYVGVCTVLVAVVVTATTIATKEVARVIRKAAGSPLITDGVDPDYREHEAFSIDSAWRSAGSDWVAPGSIREMTTALRYGRMAQSRSTALHYVGKGMTLVFGSLLIYALVWSFNESRHPIATIVPTMVALPLLAGLAMERRVANLKVLCADYSDAARRLLSETEEVAPPRVSAGQRFLQMLGLSRV